MATTVMTHDFKIEDNIPLPDPDPSEELDRLFIAADEEEDDEDPEVPGKRGRKPRCSRTDKHVWEEISDTEQKCKLCSEVFPCRNEAKCYHMDCWEKRGRPDDHPWIKSGYWTRVGDNCYVQPETHDCEAINGSEAEAAQEVSGSPVA